ncbi:PR domain zinc finger protein 10-like [Adelges cooleyi]|uniref:PR domain zinc finger protein 10-like n=1 Tax=Adelges cooleyi TaxID=133065 RepID=UPI00217F3212|nr:PR domain zinc finger protein 10-like [Adelges cooleyi]XP_050442985.1 PR domain zinc finger protein 10-like [Adelges cooleyi]
MDLKENTNTNWCQNDFDNDDINQPGPSESKPNTDHFLIDGIKFKNFIKDTFSDDNIVLTDSNGRPYDTLTNSGMHTMRVLDNQASTFEITKNSPSVILPEYNDMADVENMVSIPEQYFQSDLYHLKSDHIPQVSNTHSVMENLTDDNSLVQIDSMCMIQKQNDAFTGDLENNQEMILNADNNRFLFSENGNNFIEVTLKDGQVINNDENGFYVLPRITSVQGNLGNIGPKIVTIDDLTLLTSPKTHHNVELLVNHEELVDDIDTCDIAVVDESQIPLNNSQEKDRMDEEPQVISIDIHHQNSSGFQRMSKEAIEKIAEEFVRQPQCIDEDICINFVSQIKPRVSTTSEYWCDECNKVYLNEMKCPLHLVNSIIDPAVQTRARASLPASHLRITKVKTEEDVNVFGVFARKAILKRTQFGPLEGVIIKEEECIDDSMNEEFKYLVEVGENQFRRIDVSSEDNSNWMHFVRPAKTKQEQNMRVDQIGDYLYFTTTRTIYQREELLVGYSTFYAHKRGLPLLSSVNDQALSPVARKPVRSPKTFQGLSKQTSVGKHSITPRGSVGKHFACKHTARKRLVTNRADKNIQCNMCVGAQNNPRPSLAFKRKTNLIKLNNGVKNVWMCVSCDLKFIKRETIRIHDIIHEVDFDSEEVTLVDTKCPECHSDFGHAEELAKHVGAHGFLGNVGGAAVYYNCQMCDRRYRNVNHLKTHQAKHKADEFKEFKCTVCDKRFLNSIALTIHVRKHYEGVIYDCPICQLTFNDLKLLKEHVHTHAVNNMFYCQLCPRQFKTYKMIRKHIRAMHNPAKFVCDCCNRIFNSRFSLSMHMRSHSDQRDFLCTMCGKQFKRKDKLKVHMNRIHYGKKKKSKTAEKIEARALRKERQLSKIKSPKAMLDYENSTYRCDKCVVGFKKRGVFVNHLVSRHPEISLDSVPSLNQPVVVTTKIYACLYCDKVYKTNAKRKSHIIKNHPNCDLPQKPTDKTVIIDSDPSSKDVAKSQVHSCQWCYKQYVLKDKLMKHQRANHFHLLPPFLQVPKNTKKPGNKTKKTDQLSATPTTQTTRQTQTISLQFTEADGFELAADNIELDNPMEPGNIIAIKHSVKDVTAAEFMSHHDMGDLDMTESKDGLNDEQQIYYRILETQGDVAFVQAIDPPQPTLTSLITLDGQTIQQVLYSCGTSTDDDVVSPVSPQPSTSANSV